MFAKLDAVPTPQGSLPRSRRFLANFPGSSGQRSIFLHVKLAQMLAAQTGRWLYKTMVFMVMWMISPIQTVDQQDGWRILEACTISQDAACFLIWTWDLQELPDLMINKRLHFYHVSVESNQQRLLCFWLVWVPAPDSMCAAQALPQMSAAGSSWGWDHEYVASAMALDGGYPDTKK